MSEAFHAQQSIKISRQLPGFYFRYGKRIVDLVLVVVLAPVVLVAIGALSLIVRRDGGPALFGHERVGLNGQRFRCWKIRTMVVDAEERLEQLLERDTEAAAEWARDQKLTHDPRINRFGHFLRKTSLDELPQIWNVLRGEMSFVGPRPVVTDELQRYGSKIGFYLAQKPGITGLWQVSGRNDVTYDERVDMDVEYAKKRSLLLDLFILGKTGVSVLGVTGR